jgi:glutamate formiminotransferase/formiminotetrahydrofolate cyclodeaminase
VANLTVGRKGQEDVWEEMIRIAERAQVEKDAFLRAVDDDTEAFNAVMTAMRMKGKTDEEKAAKEAAVREANRGATLVPLSVLERTHTTLELSRATAEKGNPNSLSDAGVAGLASLTCAEGAYYNVLINLNGMARDSWVDKTRARAKALVDESRSRAAELAKLVEDRLNSA